MTAALPDGYTGDTLKELPGMIISAREAGFDAATREPKTAELVLRYIKSAGITLFKDSRDRAFMTVPQEGGGALNYPLSSELAKAFIQRLYYREQSTPLAPAKDAPNNN